jgi:hypothetical protein
MTTQGKKTTSYVLAGLGLAASIGGIFYASKKGYGGWGKFGMFLLFGAPFNIASGAFSMSAQQQIDLSAKEESDKRYKEKLQAMGIEI